MLVSLVKNSQLKKRLDKCSPASLVLVVHDTGQTYKKLDVKTKMIETFQGDAVATFDLLVQIAKLETMFDNVETFIQKSFKSKGGEVRKCLLDATSLTIKNLAKVSNISRDEARMLMDELVAAKAYKQYYSYWKRAPEFGAWVRSHW